MGEQHAAPPAVDGHPGPCGLAGRAVTGASVFAAAAARSAGTFTPHGVEAVASGLGLLVVAWICMRPGWRLAWPALLWPLGAAGLAYVLSSP